MDSAKAQRVFQKIHELPTLPIILGSIMQVMQDPRSSAADLERVISNDPSITTKVLRLANSAFFGQPKRVDSLKQAIVLLGFNATANLAMSVTLIKTFSNGQGLSGLYVNSFWQHCIATSIIARRIIRTVMPSLSEQAFTAGLLHDLGVILFDQKLQMEYSPVFQVVKKDKIFLAQAEMQELGFNHCETGRIIGRKYNLPSTLINAITNHHGPIESFYPITCAVHIANIGAKILGYGYSGDESLYQPIHISQIARETMKLDPEFPRNIEPLIKADMAASGEIIAALTR